MNSQQPPQVVTLLVTPAPGDTVPSSCSPTCTPHHHHTHTHTHHILTENTKSFYKRYTASHWHSRILTYALCQATVCWEEVVEERETSHQVERNRQSLCEIHFLCDLHRDLLKIQCVNCRQDMHILVPLVCGTDFPPGSNLIPKVTVFEVTLMKLCRDYVYLAKQNPMNSRELLLLSISEIFQTI